MTEKNNNLSDFKPKKWFPLTEIPDYSNVIKPPQKTAAADEGCKENNSGLSQNLTGISHALIKLIYDIINYPFSSVSIRLKRLGLSARAFENLKLEGILKGFITESSCGQTLYLIPKNKAFGIFNIQFPFENEKFLEHSFYKGLGKYLLEKDPSYRKVQTEVNLSNSDTRSDIVTVRHNGTRLAWEITLSTTNILTNAVKYEQTDFSQIIFLCRNYKLEEAVKACCREGGLNPDLLARIDFTHFSKLLQKQRKFFKLY